MPFQAVYGSGAPLIVSDTDSLTSFGVKTLAVQGSGQFGTGAFVGAVPPGTVLGFGGHGASDFPIRFSQDRGHPVLVIELTLGPAG